MSFLTKKPENTPETPATKPAQTPVSETSKTSAVSLAELYRAISESQRQITDYLLKREENGFSAPAGPISAVGGGAPTAAQLQPVLENLNMLGQYLDQQMVPALNRRFDALEEILKNLPASAAPAPSAASEPAPTPEPEQPQPEEPADDLMNSDPLQQSAPQPQPMRLSTDLTKLDKAFFGEMALEPSIENERQYLLQGILAHDPSSCYFGGILMMFQASTPEKMVLLLKDVGEAFYRWANAIPGYNVEQFEDVLARWAQWLCESAGLPNRIELVMPGQRFDSSRHNAVNRGATIARVHGWVVLRGNGSVYSKALVDVE